MQQSCSSHDPHGRHHLRAVNRAAPYALAVAQTGVVVLVPRRRAGRRRPPHAARPDGGPWRARARHDPLSVPAGARRRHGGTHRGDLPVVHRLRGDVRDASVGSPTRESSGCGRSPTTCSSRSSAPSPPRSPTALPTAAGFAEVIPHLTVATGLDGAESAALETTLTAKLPVTATVDRLTLLVEDDGGVWHAERSWPLGDRAESAS